MTLFSILPIFDVVSGYILFLILFLFHIFLVVQRKREVIFVFLQRKKGAIFFSFYFLPFVQNPDFAWFFIFTAGDCVDIRPEHSISGAPS